MEVTVVFDSDRQRANTWVGYLASRDEKKIGHHPQKPQDVIVDKAELTSEVSALLSSIGVALAHLDHKRHASVRRQEYLSVQSDAQRVLSALSEPGSSYQLEALMSQESAIRGTFTLEEDRS